MTIKQFNKKYKDQGGIKQLSKMREELETLKEIAKHFNVCVERIRQWTVEFFGEIYDPRYERRKRTIEVIKSLIKRHGVEKTRTLYPDINRSYLQEAIDNSIPKHGNG